MAISQELLDILACPKCKGDLTYHAEQNALDCPACNLRYRVEDDIPVMLIEEAKKGGGGDNITLAAISQGWPTRTWSSLTERALYQANKLSHTVVDVNDEVRATLIRFSTPEDLVAAVDDLPVVPSDFLLRLIFGQ